MATLQEAVDQFLAQKRIAVMGVSRDSRQPANSIYNKLKNGGYEVFPVNPNADEVEGVPCYHDIASIPDGVNAVFIATHPQVTKNVVEECVNLGIKHIWMHRSIGEGSVDEGAVVYGRENGITVIDGGCPMMFVPPVDFGHKCMKWFFSWTGSVPKEVPV